MNGSFPFSLKLFVTIAILVASVLMMASCGGAAIPTPAPPTSVGKVPVQPTQGGTGAQGGANSPENAVLAALKAIEANDANAYLDVVDPQFRSNIGNYFFFSQFMSAFTQVFGLGGTLGKDASKVNFRDLNAKVIGTQGALTQVLVSGFVRSPSFGTEQAFEDTISVRQISGRWFISAPTASETTSATRTATQLQDEQTKRLTSVILQGRELVFAGNEAITLRPDSRWITIPKLVTLFDSRNGISQFKLSPDKNKIAWVEEQINLEIVGVMNVDGSNRRELLRRGYNIGGLRINWSADNQRLVVADQNVGGEKYAVLIVDISSGKVDTIWKGQVIDALYMPDNKRILLSYETAQQDRARGGVLAIYDPDSGDEKKIANLPFAPENMVWSPDGKQIAFNYYWVWADKDPPTQGIWLMNSDGSNPRRIINKCYRGNPLWSPDGALILYHVSTTSALMYCGERPQPQPIEIVRSDGTPLIGGNLKFPEGKGGVAAWWINGSTPAIKRQIDFVEQGDRERAINVNLTNQRYGLKFTLKEFQITKDRVRVHLLLENTGEFGRVFLQPTEMKLYILNQTDVTKEPNLGNNPFTLKIVTDMPSALPVGKSWDGWLESDKPVPADAVGAILVFKSFEFEKAYDQSGNTKSFWDSTQKDQRGWYQPLR